MKIASSLSRKLILLLCSFASLLLLAGLAGCSSASNSVGGGVAAPVITTQPADQSAMVGATATFTVTASSSAAATYDWRKNGASVGAPSAASYTTPALTLADNGALYSVVVTNSGGAVTSSSAKLTILATPVSIVTQPAPQGVADGATATFSVVAAGTAPLTYDWRKNGISLAGANAPSYTTPAVSLVDDGASFTVVVTNATSNVSSAPARLSVSPVAPSVTTQPLPQSSFVGARTTFSVVAAGSTPLTYDWRKNGTSLGAASSASYTTPALALTDDASLYSVVVTNAAGTVTSAAAKLSVANAGPSIVTQPAPQTGYVGSTATFLVVANGTAPLTYDWRLNGVSAGAPSNPTFVTPVLALTDNGTQVTVVVTNALGTVTSSAAKLSVSDVAPSIVTQPTPQSGTVGNKATFTVVAAGSGPLTYVWLRNGLPLPTNNRPTYTTPNLQISDDGALYSVTITNALGSVTSATAKLTVTIVAPTITTQPAAQSASVSGTASFAVTASGSAPLQYDWRKNGTTLNAPNAPTYTSPVLAATDDGGLYTVVVSNGAGTVASNPAKLTVTVAAPAIVTQPFAQNAIAGTSATFSVVASGSLPLTYDWRKNGTSLAAPSLPSYTTPVLTVTDDGSLYTVVVTNSGGTVTSTPARLSVNLAGPTITTQPAALSRYSPQAAAFSVAATGTGTLSYQWFRNGTAIAGATSNSYSLASTEVSDNANVFYVAVKDNNGTTSSANALLTVLQGVTFTKVGGREWAASNGLISISMDPTGSQITKLSTNLNGTITNWLDPNFGSPFGHAIGFYFLANGTGASTTTPGFNWDGYYLDMWVTIAANPSYQMEVENHWVIRVGDAGVHTYQILRHTAAMAAATFGAATINFFPSTTGVQRLDGTTTFLSKDSGPNNLGFHVDSFPDPSFTNGLVAANPGRQVQKECVDYTAAASFMDKLNQPGLDREFITKYNYGTYALHHVAHGFYAEKNAFFWVIPSLEGNNGGPEKQVLSTIQMEYQSGHLGGQNLNFAAGETRQHIYGPFYLHFNQFDSTHLTATDLYNDAAGTVASDRAFYDVDTTLTGNGYVPLASRGSVTGKISSANWSTDPNKNIVVLSDNRTFLHETAQNYQYWAYADANGNYTIPNVNPGTYRLTAYILGQFGLFHVDDVVVGATVKTVNATMAPRSFGTQAPLWTIGIPDRSAHEFNHGHAADGTDVKDYVNYNYWADLIPGRGKVVFDVAKSNYATDWPFTQWSSFAPGLYAGIYPGGSTSGSNGYDFITPQYVKTDAAAQGKTPATYGGAPWEIHFTTTAAQQAQGGYVLLSINTASSQSTHLFAQLNGTHNAGLLWYPRLGSDPQVRSGVSGYNNYVVFQFAAADLKPVGQDNVITLSISGVIMYDALKLEISPTSADPAVTGMPEYDWLYYDAGGKGVLVPASAP